MNVRLWRLFDEGHAIDLLLGQGEFFIPNHTYTHLHDRILVIGQLVEWAKSRQRLNRVEGLIAQGFHRLAKKNLLEALQYLWDLNVFVRHSIEGLPFPAEKWKIWFEEIREEVKAIATGDESFARLLNLLETASTSTN